MLAGVLLHVIAAAFGVNDAPYLGAWRKNLGQAMPDLALFIFVNVYDSRLERNAGCRLRIEGACIERLSTAGGIEGGAVELQRPTRLGSIAPEFLNVEYVGWEVEEEGVVVVE